LIAAIRRPEIGTRSFAVKSKSTGIGPFAPWRPTCECPPILVDQKRTAESLSDAIDPKRTLPCTKKVMAADRF